MQFSRSSVANNRFLAGSNGGNGGSGGNNAFINKSTKSTSNMFDTQRKREEEQEQEQEPEQEPEQEQEQEQKQEQEQDQEVRQRKKKEKEAVEEFPELISATTAATTTTTTIVRAVSYKDLLVSTIDRRMVEEQSKMRSAQAAELERGGEYYSKILLADARAARAVASNAAAETDLEYMYDEDGCERS